MGIHVLSEQDLGGPGQPSPRGRSKNHWYKLSSFVDSGGAAWLVVALLSMVVWIFYGSLAAAPAIVWANALTFVQAGFILAVKVQTGR